MNHISQHAFEAAQPGECCNTVSPKRIEINATPTQERVPVRNAWLFIGRFDRFNLWLACEQALLFGQAKRASRERACLTVNGGHRRSLARSRAARFARPNRRACSQANLWYVPETV